ncbi:hypothetical protein TH66_10850 [Carbonactinospora thermoautotrophica]|uniref:Uncharacterized protein n=1 Tax=Carbonactinospora thermoautotrophica TaxID=1469144 RepID=A0A132N2M7_9ACTN|nr:hypothetical protein [Carbonactinospora thermoautotrophica]KWX03842.1 hypothetical protein TH66_10850 [Carbonactinospora thermoautotrophica]KWX09782.1 hypothetical protein TR74_07550 [Carbonactinospora thermoautotrophica]
MNLTTPAQAARSMAGRGPGVRSREAGRLADDLLRAPAPVRRKFLATLKDNKREMAFVFQEVRREIGSLYGLWHDTPSGFVEDVIGETVWSKQREFLDAIVTHKRVAIPAGFGVGKTFGAGRLVAWAGAVNAPGSIVIVTTATRFRQVRYQLWPHIRSAVTKAGLPGTVDTTQWKMPDVNGNEVVVAYGFTAPPNDEAAMQGIHGTPKLLLVVDEAGGIDKLIGRGTNNLLTGDAKLLAIGNPPMNEPGSWFEELCAEGEDPEEPATSTIRIAAIDSPAITGEPTPVCKACVPNLDGHTIAGGVPSHLPDWDWLHRTLREYGAPVERSAPLDEVVRAINENPHPYLVAKVLAQFPKDSGNRVIPASWVEAAELAEDSTGEGYVRLCDLGLPDETETFTVKRGAWVRLGVDVAADGGDEFAIYRAIGDVVHKVHVSSGAQNADPARVAERVLEEIDRAQRLANALGTRVPVRVKVDKNGLGWGVVGNLERWAQTGRHKAQIVGVMVSERPEKDDPGAVMRPYRKRDEMWLAGRFLLQPDPSTGYGRLRLRVDHQCKVQLSNPQLGHHTTGYVVVESKESMRKRGVSSPDRAEAALLALYEPYPVGVKKRRGLLVG